MKLLLKILCILTLIFCFYFPLTYFHSIDDKREVKISHILVDSEDRIKEIRQDILDKKIFFDDAAKQNSTCESAKNGGDIGYTMRGFLIKEFEDEAFRLPAYVVSEPLKTDKGWHLIKVTDIKYFSDKENFGKRY